MYDRQLHLQNLLAMNDQALRNNIRRNLKSYELARYEYGNPLSALNAQQKQRLRNAVAWVDEANSGVIEAPNYNQNQGMGQQTRRRRNTRRNNRRKNRKNTRRH